MTTQNPVYASQAKPWLKYYAQKYIDQTLPTLSAFDYVCHRNRNHLNDTALDYYGRKFTYADLIVNVKKTAAALRGVGVKKGDIVTVVSVMTPDHCPVLRCRYGRRHPEPRRPPLQRRGYP